MRGRRRPLDDRQRGGRMSPPASIRRVHQIIYGARPLTWASRRADGPAMDGDGMRSPALAAGRVALLPLALLALAVLLAMPAAAYPVRTTYDREFAAIGGGPFVLADFTGNGYTDLAAADSSAYPNGSVWIYNGSGQGLGQSPSFGIPVPGVIGLAVADLNGDGRPDLLAVDGRNVLLFNHGVLSPPTLSFGVPEGALAVAAGDLNGDGLQDLAVLGTNGARVFFQQAMGEPFTATRSLAVPDADPVVPFQSLVVGDLNGDGRVDLALAKPYEVDVYFQGVDGNLALSHFSPTRSTGGPVALGIVEVGDAHELVVASAWNGGPAGYVGLWRWDGATFVTDATFSGPFTASLAVGDVNDDGHADLAVVAADGSVDLYLQRAGSFGTSAPDLVLQGAAGTAGERVAIGDLNGDGFADILVRSRTPDVFLAYLQEDAMPVQIQAIPSTYAVNRDTTAKGVIDLRQFFTDDHNRLTFAVAYESDPGHLRATVDGAALDFDASGSWYGAAEFRVSAWDGNPNHVPVESNAFSVLVNDPPEITSAPGLRAVAGQPYGYVVTFRDAYPANDPHTFSLLAAPDGMTIDAATGLVSWRPTASQAGSHDVSVAVRDGYGGVAVQAFSIVVAPAGGGSPALLMVVGVAASSAALVAAAGLLNENAKYLFFLIVAPLYTKIKRERVLDHFVRGQIFGYIQANPGEHYNAIKDALGLTNGSLAHHLRTLEREQFIKSKRYGLYRRFYPMNYHMPAHDVYTPNDIQLTILAAIRDHPGITQKEIAQRLGLTPPTVNYHIGVLSDRNLIRVERRGRSTHCSIIEGSQT